MAKKLVKVLLSSLSKVSLVNLVWQNVLNPCRSILILLIVICVKIFYHCLESFFSVRLQFSFFISFVLIKTQLG